MEVVGAMPPLHAPITLSEGCTVVVETGETVSMPLETPICVPLMTDASLGLGGPLSGSDSAGLLVPRTEFLAHQPPGDESDVPGATGVSRPIAQEDGAGVLGNCHSVAYINRQEGTSSMQLESEISLLE